MKRYNYTYEFAHRQYRAIIEMLDGMRMFVNKFHIVMNRDMWEETNMFYSIIVNELDRHYETNQERLDLLHRLYSIVETLNKEITKTGNSNFELHLINIKIDELRELWNKFYKEHENK